MCPITVLCLALSAASSNAALIITPDFDANELAYAGDVSDSDLVEGTGIFTDFNNVNGASGAELTDGIHGGNFTAEGNTVSGAWTKVGATVEFNLGTGDNSLGYDITSIQSIAAWVNVDFGHQGWTLDFKGVGEVLFRRLS